MDQIKQLQKRLSEGKITQEQYEKQLKELLDDEDITQEEHDEAAEYEPETGDDPKDKPIFSQNDVDGMITQKSRKMLRAELKKAGVDLNGVKGSELLNKVAEWAQNGQAAGEVDADQKEVQELRRKAKAYDESQGTLQQLQTENAVLKAADGYKPHSMKQLTRAMADYDDYLDYDDEGNLDPKSVDRALKAVKSAEPNLFVQSEEDPDGEGEGGDDQHQQKGNFSGKSPGRGNGGAGKKTDQTVKAGLDMLGINQNKQ